MRIVKSWLLALALSISSLAWSSNPLEFAGFEYRVVPNVAYRELPNWTGRIDLYIPNSAANKPTLFWIHGGGWTRSSKEEELLYVLPYIAQGWSVAVVEYRLADVAAAPAAVEDCLCALAWLLNNSAAYGIPTEQLVISGISAGGHLALTTAGLTSTKGPCSVPEEFQPAAVVNWFGPSDLADLAFGNRPFDQAVEWIRGQANVAVEVSPINSVTKRAPPVLTIHGDSDDVIPFSQSVRLHQSLSVAGVPNELLAVAGAGHGDFTPEQVARAYTVIRAFLQAHADQP